MMHWNNILETKKIWTFTIDIIRYRNYEKLRNLNVKTLHLMWICVQTKEDIEIWKSSHQASNMETWKFSHTFFLIAYRLILQPINLSCFVECVDFYEAPIEHRSHSSGIMTTQLLNIAPERGLLFLWVFDGWMNLRNISTWWVI